jgi:hypothetical protein
MTDFNYAPYYDDFNSDKGFHRVLFRPGVPLQSRELNQLQTILQNQIAKFGEHIFKHGSMVIPGSFKYDNNVQYLKLNSIYDGLLVDVNKFLFANDYNGTTGTPENRTIEGITSGVRALVLAAEPEDTATSAPPTLIYKLISNGINGTQQDFLTDEGIKLVDSIDLDTNVSTGSTIAKTLTSGVISGKSSITTIDNGVYFINGIFVGVKKQAIVLDKYSDTPSYEVGLRYNETIVTETEDLSLLDPALGASNYNGPGAHRYKIDLELIKIGPNEVAENNFVLLFRVVNGIVQEIRDKTQYSELMKMIARRTYEESGNYITNTFEHKVIDNKNDPTLAGMIISGGQAFIGGYEIDNTVGFNYVEIPKAKDTKSLTGAIGSIQHGQFLLSANNYGIPSPLSIIELRDNSIVDVGSPNGNIIGYAKVLASDYLTGSLAKEQRILKVSGAITASATLTLNGSPGVGFSTLTDFDLYQHISNSTGTLAGVYITAVNGNVATLSAPITIGNGESVFVGSGEGIFRINITDIDMDLGKKLTDVASWKMISSTTFNSDHVCGDILSGYIPSLNEGVVQNGAMIQSMKSPLLNQAVVVLHDLNNNIIFAKKAPGKAWVEGAGSFKVSGAGASGATTFTTQSTQRLSTFNNQGVTLLQPLPNSAVSEVSSLSYSIYKEANLSFTGAGPYTATFNLTDGEKFPSVLNEQNFIIWHTFSGKILNGLISTTTNRTTTTSVTITTTDAAYGTVNTGIRVIAKVEKNLKEKTKTLVSSKETTTPAGIMSLRQPDIYALNWVFERTKDTPFNGSLTAGSNIIAVDSTTDIVDNVKLGTYIFGTGLPLGTFVTETNTVDRTITVSADATTNSANAQLSARIDISKNYILDNGQRDSQYEVGTIKLRSGAYSPTGTLDIYFQHLEPGEGDFYSVNSYSGITQDSGVDYLPFIPTFTSSSGQTYRLQDCLDFRPSVKDSAMNVYGSMGFQTTITADVTTGSPTVVLNANGGKISVGDVLYNGNLSNSLIIGTVQSISVGPDTTITLVANAANAMTSGATIVARSKVVTLANGYSTRELSVGQNVIFQGNAINTVASIESNSKFTLGTTPDLKYSNIVLNVGFENIGGRFVSPYYNNLSTPLLNPVCPGSDITFNYSHFLPRKDVITLDTEGLFKLHKGFSSAKPEFPKVLDSDKQMVVFKLELPPYTYNVDDIRVETVDRPGYTMAEIHQIDKRIDRLEEYTLLNMLEKSTTDYNITDAETGLDRYKSGFIVDNFDSLNVLDKDEFNNVKLDPSTHTLNVPSTLEAHELFLIQNESTSTTYDTTYIENGIVTLKFTEVPVVMNPYATSSMNLNPFAIFQWNGDLKLSPDFNIDIATSTSTTLQIINK